MPHKIRFTQPLRAVRVRNGVEALVSETALRQSMDDQFRLGFEAGQKALREELVQQRAQLSELQNGVLASIERSIPSLIAECEGALVLLALEAARRVVMDMPISPELMERTVRKALAELRETSEYQIALHPADLASLQEICSDVLPSAGHAQIKMIPDDRIARGDCVVHTKLGAIEAVREKMFEKLESAVLCQ